MPPKLQGQRGENEDFNRKFTCYSLKIGMTYTRCVSARNCGDGYSGNWPGCCGKTCAIKDVVARWGGEEFIILLPDTDLESAAEIMERLRQSVASVNLSRIIEAAEKTAR